MSKELKYGGLILLVMSVLTNGLNYAFQVIMGRMLTITEFGTMNALFSLIMIASLPFGVVTTTTARYIAIYKASGHDEKIKIFIKRIMLFILVSALIVLGIGIMLSGPISDYLNITNQSLCILAILVISIGMFIPLINGIVQGTKQFFNLGMLGFGATLGKLVLGILFVVVGFQLYGIMNALFFSNLLITIVGFYIIRKYWWPNESKGTTNLLLERKEILNYVVIAFLVNLSIAIFSNVDMIFIKRFFSEEKAGFYGTASLFARLILFIPNALVMAMFPIAAETDALNGASKVIIKKTLIYVGGLSLLCVLGLNLFTESLVQLLMGDKFLPSVPYVRGASFMAIPVGLLITLANYCLAVNKIKMLSISMAIGSICCIIAIEILHATIPTILIIIALIASILFVVNLLFLFKQPKQIHISKSTLEG
ncbi:oligosaccharide flippase family protein [Paenibacillus humicus]|uniref:oligosaccharide flippase family protein n=1 Tax=Paenibacillus humicus TaxID=412861 RepID=UPI003F152631